jgi:hypothetical protein
LSYPHRVSVLALASLALAGCTAAASPAIEAPRAACAVSDADRTWIDRALEAWRYSAEAITGIGKVHDFQAVFFDAGCALTSPDALNVGWRATWYAVPHAGTVALPDGEAIPASVTSFTHAGDGKLFLAMSLPSIWREAGIDNAGIGLETMMVAVLIHEGSHVSQGATYGTRMTALSERHALPESFDDDAIQRRFESDPDFAASIAQEIVLLFKAAAAPDGASAVTLVREARALMRARATRYFTGIDSYLSEAEDIWLTMEGSGQWAAYQWVIDPRGAAESVEVAMPHLARRSRWWSQNEGIALYLALDRIAGSSWKDRVFGDGAHTVLELLDAAIAQR